MTAVLSVRDLTVTYGTHTALDHLSVDMFSGEITGLIGPNGAGKTSLIKALCGRLGHAQGDIAVGGKRLARGKNRQKLIGLVPQDIGLYPHMTSRENLMAFARIMGISPNVRKLKVDAALRAVGLMDKAGARVDALSGGMKRRINVAAAIMHGPKLLILDEPTAGVDVPARDTIHRLSCSLAKAGLGVLLVTHELEQAEALCDKLLILAGGRKLAFDSPAHLLTHCYHGAREVMVRFAAPPSPEILQLLQPFRFSEGELPTIWTTMTEIDEARFVNAFMSSLTGHKDIIRELSVRRPGLSSLMRHIEKHQALPC